MTPKDRARRFMDEVSDIGTPPLSTLWKERVEELLEYYFKDAEQPYHDLVAKLEKLTPGGSKFHQNPTTCLRWIKREKAAIQQIALKKSAECNTLRAKIREIKNNSGVTNYIQCCVCFEPAKVRMWHDQKLYEYCLTHIPESYHEAKERAAKLEEAMDIAVATLRTLPLCPECGEPWDAHKDECEVGYAIEVRDR